MMKKYRVTVELPEGAIDLPQPDSDAPWEFATREEAAMAAIEAEGALKSPCAVYMLEARIRPVGDHVVLRVCAKPERTASGLYLPSDESRGREDRGEVLAVGSGVKLDNGSPKPGEVVCFDPYKVRLAVGDDGADITNSVHAQAGMLAIVPSSAIRYVEE